MLKEVLLNRIEKKIMKTKIAKKLGIDRYDVYKLLGQENLI